MDGTRQVPEHLRQFVVSQDYAAYTVEDQAVWRFVLLQTYERHLRSAHPAYPAGFAAAGISVEQIPCIATMNERLSEHAFEAVCVDGFIPPRAFQAFQARGFLPIAADIRTSRHLAYTPAPDIIHEAAGHAPFLAHRDYARYLRRIGAIGEKSFASARDRETYEAIHLLSELKEDPLATPLQRSRAEARVAQLIQSSGTLSEAARLARLYWWTVEYGLIGTPTDYRLYGAGLLSSIGEGHFCHDAAVTKLPLGAACIDVAYDITRPQPQLFVARDFEQLNEVLDEVARGFAFQVGGVYALEQAVISAEPATLELTSGLQIVGTVVELVRDLTVLSAVRLSGGCAVSLLDQVIPDLPRPRDYLLPLGALRDGTPLAAVSAGRLRDHCDSHGQLRVELSRGLVLSGRVLRVVERAGCVQLVLLSGCTITRGDQVLLTTSEVYPWLLAEQVVTAHARPPQGYYPATEFSDTRVPKPRAFTPEQRDLIGLYDRAIAGLRECFGADVVPRFEAIHAALCERHPDEWLLRWNLLESLVKLGQGESLGAALAHELELLELRFAHQEPIATGLAYLREVGLTAKNPKQDPRGSP